METVLSISEDYEDLLLYRTVHTLDT